MGKKGRNRRLIEARNRKIVQRYYYWTEVRRLRFDDAVKELSEHEFFLSEFMIWQILKKSSASNTPEEFKVVRKHKMTKVDETQLMLFTDEGKP
ncbi:MAG: transposase [Candidatus Cryptobacteroides sp.]